ncbi:hypothetical protein INS49_014100 [Diaporthe citri]|uniref:uncharacterized protein n=1 Tax=Diaporthe citri TaxID=83186 RepID=UPI001C7F8D8F|nr:uncharacterized protein INS49_014100 [Diaporthe citri]KAG6358216.1 hypothetical protein INS49_014100 [Diaporthe citri]
MLPPSYDKVSEETKKVVQLFMAHARGFLQGRGKSDWEARTILENYETEATCNALKMADGGWEESRQPCSAEQFVQWFAELVWDGLTDDDHTPFPYNFSAAVVGGPLSTEFLEAIGKTEAEVLGMIKKESSPEEGVKLALHTIPAFVKTETSPPGTPNAPAVPSDPLALLAQRLKAELQSSENNSILGKRKNDEPDTTSRKKGRGNDEQRVPPASRDTNRTYKQWGATLTAEDEQLMDVSLMNNIWYSNVSKRLRRGHGSYCFRVKIPKEKGWSLLGQDIARVFGFIRTDWRPIRLYTYESDRFLHVGLMVRKCQTKEKNVDVVRDKLPELFRILRRWSVQAQRSEKADGLADFLDLNRYMGA